MNEENQPARREGNTPVIGGWIQSLTSALGTKSMEIRIDNLRGPEIAALLTEHLECMAQVSPPESRHALDLERLRQPQSAAGTRQPRTGGDEHSGVDEREIPDFRLTALAR